MGAMEWDKEFFVENYGKERWYIAFQLNSDTLADCS